MSEEQHGAHCDPGGQPAARLRLIGRVLVVTLACLALGEGITRQWLTSPSAQQFDAELGWTWRPGATVANHKEGWATHHINERGLLDDPISPKAGRRRVLAVGNSFLEALQVPQAENYTSRLERLRPHLDVINLGRSGFGPAHYPTVIARYADLQPDLILVGVGESDGVNLLKPEVVVEGSHVGVKPARADRLKAMVEPLVQRSALATYLMRRFKPLVLRALRPAEAAAPEPVDDVAQAGEARRRFALVLDALQATAPVLVVYTPHLSYHADHRTQEEAPHERALLAGGAADAGVPFVDVGPAFVARYAATGQPPVGFANHRIDRGHLNAAGHALVAEALAARPELRP